MVFAGTYQKGLSPKRRLSRWQVFCKLGWMKGYFQVFNRYETQSNPFATHHVKNRAALIQRTTFPFFQWKLQKNSNFPL
jgi:hypothetical protein